MPSITGGLLLAVATLLAWRLYQFTLRPVLGSSEPQEYPYWVPIIGHLRAFFQNSSKLLTDARIYFKDTRAPFSLTVAGQTWYVLTNGEHVAAAYKISDGSLSYDIFAVEVLRMLGASEDGVKKSFKASDLGSAKTGGKTLSMAFRELSRLQLQPGKQHEVLDPALRYISDHLKLPMLLEYNPAENVKTATVNLYHLISEMFVGFGQEMYFGKSLAKVQPDMISEFVTFDTLAWQVLYQYPSFMCKKVLAAKEKVVSGLERYFELPVESRSDAAWMTLELEKAIWERNICMSDAAIIFFQLYWRKAPFWMLVYMLFTPDLVQSVRDETSQAFTSDDVPDTEYLLNFCPILNGIWDENLRITSFGASVRFLTQDTEIGGKLLRKGNRIMMSQRQLHFDARVFGVDTGEFKADRFVENAKLNRNASFRPFGGGATLCPGRHLAKQTSLAFVALLLHRFDVTLDPACQSFPIPTEGTPSIGLVDVMEGSDLRVKLTPR